MDSRIECLILFAEGLCVSCMACGIVKLSRYVLENIEKWLEEEDNDEDL